MYYISYFYFKPRGKYTPEIKASEPRSLNSFLGALSELRPSLNMPPSPPTPIPLPVETLSICLNCAVKGVDISKK